MTKNILLAATALTVMAFAGGAAAQVQITGAKVSGNVLAVSDGTTDELFTVAAESNGTEANRTTTTAAGDNVIASELKTGRFDAGAGGTNYTATITLTGAVFADAVLNADINVTGDTGSCVVSAPTVVSGGAAGQSTAQVVFNVGSTCSTTDVLNFAPNGVAFDVPFIKNAGAGGVGVSISYAVATTGAAYGGAAGSADLVQVLNGYSVYARLQSASTRLPTTFALASYTSLATGAGQYDNVIGQVAAAASSPLAASAGAFGNTVFANMAGAAMPAITANVAVNGDLSVLTPSAAPVALVVNEAKTSAATAADVAVPLGTNVTVAKAAGATNTPVTTPQSFTATVTPVVAANALVTTPVAVTAALETVGQQGTSFLAPWVQSTNANYNTVIRVSNSGAAVAGVRLSLTAPVGTATATQCTSAQLPKLASIPANGELAISSADLTTCFGAFTRGDVRVTIPALTNNLTAKLRIVNPGNIVAEQSLGAIASGVATTN